MDLACGIKDIIDVAGMPTCFGVDFRETHPLSDAPCVASLRAAAAPIVGKTATTAFAATDPAKTFNPHNAARTPGGSSAGSAAAVAAGHIPVALGTQTIGSILRPASFCGVVGFKPTYGRISTAGVSPVAPSLDHVGILARDVQTASRVAQVLIPDLESVGGPAGWKVAVDSDLFAEVCGSEVSAGVSSFADRCAARGTCVVRVDLSSLARPTLSLLDTIVAYECHASLDFLRSRESPPQITGLVRRGAEIPELMYRDALAQRDSMRPKLAEAFSGLDAFMVICAGPAPTRETTGNPIALGPWSFFGAPSLTFPIGRTSEGLPFGVQIVAAPGRDARLLALSEHLAGVSSRHGAAWPRSTRRGVQS